MKCYHTVNLVDANLLLDMFDKSSVPIVRGYVFGTDNSRTVAVSPGGLFGCRTYSSTIVNTLYRRSTLRGGTQYGVQADVTSVAPDLQNIHV
ncbi:hypothetical protein J6590_040043 [Homalodisca vitripennis]|nr:hypothetical protein J6590_040043 [Homalodisca vitripennis]